MKLLHHTALNQLLLAIPLVVIGTTIGYFAVRHAVNEELDEQLEHHAELLEKRIRSGETSFSDPAPDQLFALLPTTSTNVSYVDSILYNTAEEEDIPWRMIRYPVELQTGEKATLVLGRASLESDDLVKVLAYVIAGLLVLVFIGNFLVDRWLNGRLWKPFHQTLDALKNFHTDSPRDELPRTSISEFSAMNDAVNAMMAKIQRDFSAQKRFSEQAAHELRTPLAIMQVKLDELIQVPELGKVEADMIEVLFQARERMGRTVQNMLLLARIGNQEFDPAPVDWQALFTDQATVLQELMEQRGVHFTQHQERPCELKMHPLLAELVVSNLLRNAVQHNHHGGYINLRIGLDEFAFSNSGPVLSVDPESLFDRFAKGDPSSSGTGLGLSMVKEACDNAGLDLQYTEVGGVHAVVVSSRS